MELIALIILIVLAVLILPFILRVILVLLGILIPICLFVLIAAGIYFAFPEEVETVIKVVGYILVLLAIGSSLTVVKKASEG